MIKKQKIFMPVISLTLLLFFVFSSPVNGISSEQSSMVDQAVSQKVTDTQTATPYNCGAYCKEFATETAVPYETPVPTAKSPLASKDSKVTIYLFWGDGCPHCETAKLYLNEMLQTEDEVELVTYEVWYVEENQRIFIEMAAAFGFEPRAVPTIFVGNQYWEGFNDQIKEEIQKTVKDCLQNGCTNPGEAESNPDVVQPEEESTLPPQAQTNINLPILGAIDLSTQSLLVSTMLISFVDGFNPCSIWVLTMLLALTLHSGSRRKILLIGLIFLTVSTVIYGLFITGLFTMFTVVSFVGWIQVVVALVALVFAVVNIKDYFWYKEGVSFTIADDKKPGIFQRMRRLMDAGTSFWGLVGGTIVLAAGVSLVEFSCTAGFPVLWTNLLVSQTVTPTTFILLLMVYLLIYQLDEMAIFLVAVFTMRASKLEEKHGRILKLTGGMLMLALAGVMIIDPSLMNDLSSSLVVFGFAFAATLLILLIHRFVLPKLGIHLGSEFSEKVRAKRSKSK
jgi:glutaredoxin